jgi:hypothetical protein
MYYYFSKCSRIGVFFIRKQSEIPNHWDLFINGLFLGSYIAPELAADAVFQRKTNFNNWDKFKPDLNIPHNLSGWKRVDEDYHLVL